MFEMIEIAQTTWADEVATMFGTFMAIIYYEFFHIPKIRRDLLATKSKTPRPEKHWSVSHRVEWTGYLSECIIDGEWRGSSTVWHNALTGKRAGSARERVLADIYEKAKWEKRDAESKKN